MKRNKQFKIVIMSFAAGLAGLIANNASAQLVSGWGYDTAATSGSASTVTEGSPGSFIATPPSGSAAIRADLATPLDFSTIGLSYELSGAVALAGPPFGNNQFRFGLYDINTGSAGTLSSGVWSGDTATGWLGYMVEAGNAATPNTTFIAGRNNPNSGAWDSGTGASAVAGTPASSGTWASGSATFNFDLTLTRLSATSVGISYDIIETDGVGTYDVSETGLIDTASGSNVAAFNSIDSVGFLLTGSSGGGASFSDITVEAVPEPSAFALAGLGLAGLLGWKRRK